jgi:hypothetical protein
MKNFKGSIIVNTWIILFDWICFINKKELTSFRSNYNSLTSLAQVWGNDNQKNYIELELQSIDLMSLQPKFFIKSNKLCSFLSTYLSSLNLNKSKNIDFPLCIGTITNFRIRLTLYSSRTARCFTVNEKCLFQDSKHQLCCHKLRCKTRAP